jgi:hypothetical protein
MSVINNTVILLPLLPLSAKVTVSPWVNLLPPRRGTEPSSRSGALDPRLSYFASGEPMPAAGGGVTPPPPHVCLVWRSTDELYRSA